MKFPDEHPTLLYGSTPSGEGGGGGGLRGWSIANDKPGEAPTPGEAAQESFRAHFLACGQSQRSFAGLIPEILCGLN